MSDDLGNIISKDDHWFYDKWRPAMAWVYCVTCAFDFLVAPVLNGLFFAWTNQHYVPWDPVTLKAGGTYHMAMGAIVGITSWTRGNEKMKILDFAGQAATPPLTSPPPPPPATVTTTTTVTPPPPAPPPVATAPPAPPARHHHDDGPPSPRFGDEG